MNKDRVEMQEEIEKLRQSNDALVKALKELRRMESLRKATEGEADLQVLAAHLDELDESLPAAIYGADAALAAAGVKS